MPSHTPTVAPAQAGAQWLYDPSHSKTLDSRLRGNDPFF
ncbi:hypothetical protein GP5015_380 [gamma proteobacterium HTCC5015]|nr:hypothetical protein GP5015_380 [gamma proteobacterium HTCC5015]